MNGLLSIYPTNGIVNEANAQMHKSMQKFMAEMKLEKEKSREPSPARVSAPVQQESVRPRRYIWRAVNGRSYGYEDHEDDWLTCSEDDDDHSNHSNGNDSDECDHDQRRFVIVARSSIT